jgi:outer membrane protein TolC
MTGKQPIRPTRPSVFGCILIAFLGFSAAAQITEDAGEGPETLSGLIRTAGERSPDIVAARARWRAAVEKLPQAKALPDPMLRFDYFGENVETRVGPQEYRVGLSQMFPFPGTLKQAETVADKYALAQQLMYVKALRDVSIDVKLSYHELVYLRGALGVTNEQRKLTQHILKLAAAREADGKAQFADVLKAQSQVAQLEYDAILLRELAVVETARLNALLDRPTTQEIGTLAAPSLRLLAVTAAELETVALGTRQELQIAQAQAAQAYEAARLAELKTRPSFSLSAMHIETGEALNPAMDDSGKDPWMLGVGVTLPLWAAKNSSAIREAEFQYDAAQARHRSAANQTRAAVKGVYFRLENARRLIALYDKSLIPQARRAMEAAEQWHDRETADIAGFLETQGVWLNFNLARLRAVTDYQQYSARLERLLGMPLTHVRQAAEKAKNGEVEQ